MCDSGYLMFCECVKVSWLTAPARAKLFMKWTRSSSTLLVSKWYLSPHDMTLVVTLLSHRHTYADIIPRCIHITHKRYRPACRKFGGHSTVTRNLMCPLLPTCSRRHTTAGAFTQPQPATHIQLPSYSRLHIRTVTVTQPNVSTAAHVQSLSHTLRCPLHTQVVTVTHPQVSTSHTSSHWILILFSCRLLQSHNLDVLTLSLHTKMLHMLSGMYQTFTKCIITHLGLPAVTSIVPNSYDFIQVSLPVSIFHSTNISSVAE